MDDARDKEEDGQDQVEDASGAARPVDQEDGERRKQDGEDDCDDSHHSFVAVPFS